MPTNITSKNSKIALGSKQSNVNTTSSQNEIKTTETKLEDKSVSVIKAFGINIIGLDPRLILDAQLTMKIPLNEGRGKIQAIDKEAKIKISRGTIAQVNVELGRNEKSLLTLKSFSFQLNQSVTVKNPSGALEPAEGKSHWQSTLKDKAADLKLKSITIDQDGRVEVNGKIKAFHTIKKRLSRDFGTVEIPVLDAMLLSQLGILGSSETQIMGGITGLNERFNLKNLLKSLGAMTQEASYGISVNAEPSHMLLAKDNNFFRGPVSPISFNLQGDIDLEPSGDLLIVVDGQKSKFSGSVGNYTPSITAKISHLTDEQPVNINLHTEIVGVARDLRIDTFSKQQVKTVMPRTRKNKNPEAVPMPKSNDEFNSSYGASSMEVNALIDADIEIRKGIDAKTGTIKPEISVSNGQGRLALLARGPYARTHERGVTMADAVSANIDAKNITYGGKQIQNANVDASLGIFPNAKTIEQFPEVKATQFRYQADVTGPRQANINPPSYGLSTFLRPVKNFESNNERVDTKATKTNIHAIGTTKYFRQVERIAGLKIKKADQVELLIDGIRSKPKRMALIAKAQNTICFQTLVFKGDTSGWQYAKALVEAAQRGVKVYGIVDSLGNIESLRDLEKPNGIYTYLRENGVQLYLYNDFVEMGLRTIFAVAQRNVNIFPATNANSLLGVAELIRFFEIVAELADNKQGPLSVKDRRELAQGIHIMLGGKEGVSPHNAIAELKKAISDNMTTLDELLLVLKRMGDATYRWHEKYLIIDGSEAIVGGMNIADEYLLGGTGEKVVIKGKEQPAWRDSDAYLSGQVVLDIVRNFKNNWLHVAKAKINITNTNKSHKEEQVSNAYKVGMIHHRPLEDGDHNVTNFLLYNLRTLKPGERAWFETPYFLPRGALRALQKEMVKSALRGVDLRILTNSEKTSDFGPLVEAAVFDTRELLRAGARVYHRNQERMV
ncbi:MAG TPA: phosphatidylserine/phosphatidylglycerophosphate/cardiolipin synthase family protein, partial [Myxococcota bacterium]|nr:phosphatidylserine/phosphatidylglycerophosphate/cardiolipin synthase family protein [Myxococcota bacterium]